MKTTRCYGTTKQGSRCKYAFVCRWHEMKTCPICFDEILCKYLHTTTCRHTFHKECIITWYEQSDECPVCRAEQMNDPIIIFKQHVKASMEETYMNAIRSLETDVQRLRRRIRARRDM